MMISPRASAAGGRVTRVILYILVFVALAWVIGLGVFLLKGGLVIKPSSTTPAAGSRPGIPATSSSTGFLHSLSKRLRGLASSIGGTETPDDTSPPSMRNASIVSPLATVMRNPAILVLTYNRLSYLERTLRSLNSLPGIDRYARYVHQDGRDPNMRPLTDSLSFELLNRDRVARAGPRQGGTAYLTQHYKDALDDVFVRREHSHVIVCEDDMVFSPDFLTLFDRTAYLLEADPTIWCISSWNDNGLFPLVNDPRRLFRTDYFPGLGWMLRRELWLELKDKWPLDQWDYWMRLDSISKGRECVCPEVNRNYNIGEVGTNTGKSSYRNYLQQMGFNKEDILSTSGTAAAGQSSQPCGGFLPCSSTALTPRRLMALNEDETLDAGGMRRRRRERDDEEAEDDDISGDDAVLVKRRVSSTAGGAVYDSDISAVDDDDDDDIGSPERRGRTLSSALLNEDDDEGGEGAGRSAQRQSHQSLTTSSAQSQPQPESSERLGVSSADRSLDYLLLSNYDSQLHALVQRARVVGDVADSRVQHELRDLLTGTDSRKISTRLGGGNPASFPSSSDVGPALPEYPAQLEDNGEVLLVTYRWTTFRLVSSMFSLLAKPRATHKGLLILKRKGKTLLFADSFMCPFLPEGLRTPRKTLVLKAGREGQSCDATCFQASSSQDNDQPVNLRCDRDSFQLINQCSVLQKHFPCEKGCVGGVAGDDVPNYVNTPRKREFLGMCLTTESDTTCDAKHWSSQRLCPCAPV